MLPEQSQHLAEPVLLDGVGICPSGSGGLRTRPLAACATLGSAGAGNGAVSPAGAALFRHLPANDLLQRHLTHLFHGLVQLVTLAALRIPLATFG